MSLPAPSIPTPRGLETIYSTLRQIYPDQPNPLQVTALIKYWLGGPDPLDFISMFNNPGSPMEGIPSHWHYISAGLSDLHGDGRVHEVNRRDSSSGFGFELTFRLKKQVGETSPPSWPAELLQSLARYVFQTGKDIKLSCKSEYINCTVGLEVSRVKVSLGLGKVKSVLTHLAGAYLGLHVA